MHTIFKLVPLTAAIALAACGGGGDKAADAACGQLEANQICVKIGSGAPKTGGIAHLVKTMKTARNWLSMKSMRQVV